VHRPARGPGQLPQHPALIAACEITGADAIHPGYGFLSENARFAEVLEHHRITFIGPKAEHIRIMGDKIEAKRTAKRLGIPCVPGSEGGITEDDEARRVASSIGYPVIIKAAAGGGGRGMKVARTEDDLVHALQTARTEAKAAFGDDAVYLEKYLAKPRHIEIQVMGDGQGNADPSRASATARSSAATRRCGRKAPRPALNAEERERHRADGATAMQELGYSGAGTVEFLYEDGAVLLHRDEHAHPGRAPGDRDDHRHRPRQRADPHRGRLAR
jgi:acetyl-CoA carboxylase biotin carboxylase subunit